MKGYIYIISVKKNRTIRSYIGSTWNFSKRVIEYRCDIKRGKRSDKIIVELKNCDSYSIEIIEEIECVNYIQRIKMEEEWRIIYNPELNMRKCCSNKRSEQKVKETCNICNTSFQHSNRSYHFKSNKHLNNLANK